MRVVKRPPVVLIIAGNDPSGGAGISADIQTVTALGGHPAPVVSAVTVQDTVNVHALEAIDPELIARQTHAVFADMPVAAIKIGLLVEVGAVRTVARLLEAHADIPVVLDPVLSAGGGTPLVDETLTAEYLAQLAPFTTLITPNMAESRRLLQHHNDLRSRAGELLARGCRYVLIKGADEKTKDVHNFFFSHDGLQKEFSWPRLPGHYHGSGCTLASAITTLLALGYAPLAAVEQAQRYTWDTLDQGWQLGRGQIIPNRRIIS